MVLSRIWASFVIIAVIVAGIKMFGGDKTIFNRMVVGKASDPYDSVYYTSVGSPQTQKLSSNYFSLLKEYGYSKSDSAHPATVLLTDNPEQDSVKLIKIVQPGISVYTYVSVQSRLQRKADGMIQTAKSAVIDIIIPLIGIMALFMGFLSIAERAGGVRLLSRMIYPFFSKVFPDIPKGHPAIGHMMMNFSANLLNLDNAATPFGLKAIESLQELNPNKAVASNAQIMFLALHASGLTLIPVTVIAYRSGLGAKNPTDIFIPCMIATFMATMAALFIVSFKQKINLFKPVVLA
ncbi:MAG: nucleoside recognition domain-containing protein, partial [Flavisolibacter sp.]